MSDLRRIYAAQGVRAFVYGFGSVILGASLARAGLSNVEVGVVLTALLAGRAIASLTLARRADAIGRRRAYLWLLAAMGASGTIFAITDSVPLLVLAALTGTVSVEVVEAGPFTSIEQAMVPSASDEAGGSPRAFGRYNAIAAIVGSAGALAAAVPDMIRRAIPGAPPGQRWLLLYPLAAVLAAPLVARMSPRVEAERRPGPGRSLERSRGPVLRLAGLFALDSFGGGFIVHSFVVFWFVEEFGASTALMAGVTAAQGLIQAAAFLAAPWIATRIGLLKTMVFTHLPSNIAIMLIPLAPSLPIALAIYLVRYPFSQMDVPTRQAYLTLLAGPEERAAAASVTNAARSAVRPLAPYASAAATGTAFTGLPWLLAGGLKALYDLALYAWFRNVDEARLARPIPPGPA